MTFGHLLWFDNILPKRVHEIILTSLDIISNLIASLLLGVLTYFVVFNMSIPFFMAAIYFMIKIKLDTHDKKESDDISENLEGGSESTFQFLETISTFRESKFASFIVITESILSGGTDLLLTLAPLYLISEGVPIQYLGLVLAVQRLADLTGAFVAPKIKISYKKFFFIDYIVSGFSLILVFVIPIPLVKLLLFALAFIIIGISGNMFEKMIYSEYNYENMGLIYSTNSSLYALFAIIFLIIPQFYSNIHVLGIVINIFTVLVGFYLLFINNPFKEIENDSESYTKY